MREDEVTEIQRRDDDLLETRRILHEEVRLRLEVQRAAAERLEAKAAILVGLAATTAQFVVSRDLSSGWLPWAVVAYALSIASGVSVIAVRHHEELAPAATVRGLWRSRPLFVLSELINQRVKAFEINRTRHRRRVRLWWLALVAMLLAVTFSLLHLSQGYGQNDTPVPVPAPVPAPAPAPAHRPGSG